MKKLVRQLTFANVVACIALFVALGGASYAALKIPRNSVGSAQIKDEAVTAAKLQEGAITPAKLSGSAKQTLTGPAGKQGSDGPQGPAGPAGPQGAAGAAGQPATALWAVINGNATPKSVSPAFVSSKQGGTAGTYLVEFNRDVSACSFQVTLRTFQGLAFTEAKPGLPSSVYVQIQTVQDTLATATFDLAVFC